MMKDDMMSIKGQVKGKCHNIATALATEMVDDRDGAGWWVTYVSTVQSTRISLSSFLDLFLNPKSPVSSASNHFPPFPVWIG